MRQEEFGILHQILADLDQPVLDRIDALELVGDGFNGAIDDLADHFRIECADLFPPVPFEVGKPLQNGSKLLLQFADPFLNCFALLLGQKVENFRFDDLAILHWCKGKPHWRAQDADILAFGLFAQVLKCGFLFVLKLGIDCLALVAIIVRPEAGGNGFAQILHHVGHCTFEQHCRAGRQLHGQGFMRCLEIVDVNPVLRGGRLACLLFEMRQHSGVAARTLWTEREQIVAGLIDPRSKPDSAKCTILADQCVNGLQFVGRRKPQAGRVTGAAQRFALQGL